MKIHDPLLQLRDWYDKKVREHLGSSYGRDMALPEKTAKWLQGHVQKRGCKCVVELGAGFSTIAFVRALERTGGVLQCLDHSPSWLVFVGRCLIELGTDLSLVKFSTTHEFLADPDPPKFDLAFIDHGPTYTARIATIAPIVGMCRRVGCPEIILDDWHRSPSMQQMYCAPVNGVAKLLGVSVARIEESSISQSDRSLARIEVQPLKTFGNAKDSSN